MPDENEKIIGRRRLSLLLRKPDGAVYRLRGEISDTTWEKWLSARAETRKFVASATGSSENTELDWDVVPKEKPTTPLFYEGKEETESKLRLLGLHPVWGKYYRLFFKLLAWVLDLWSFPFFNRRGRITYMQSYISMGLVCMLAAAFLAVGLSWFYENVKIGIHIIDTFIGYSRMYVPLFIFGIGWALIIASFRMENKQGISRRV